MLDMAPEQNVVLNAGYSLLDWPSLHTVGQAQLPTCVSHLDEASNRIQVTEVIILLMPPQADTWCNTLNEKHFWSSPVLFNFSFFSLVNQTWLHFAGQKDVKVYSFSSLS